MNIFKSDVLPPADVKHAEVHNIDEFSAYFPGVNYDIDQIDVGRLSGSLLFVSIGDLVIGRCDGDKRIYGRGSFAPGRCTYNVVHAGNVGSRWRGRNLQEGDINFLPADSQFNHLTASQFETTFVIMPQVWLNEMIEVHPEMRQSQTPLGPTELLQINGQLNIAMDAVRADRNDSQAISRIIEIARELLTQIVLNDLQNQPAFPESRRQDVLFEALDIIYSNREHAVALIDLYKTLGISERTLHYAFKETLGVSPAQFVRSVRLNHVHRALKKSDQGATISAIVEAHGFQYSGEFASTYKTMFGELPSETIAKLNK